MPDCILPLPDLSSVVVCPLRAVRGQMYTFAPTHLVSLLSPGDSLPSRPSTIPTARHLRMHIHDVLGPNGPTEQDAAQILACAADLDADSRVLVHCQAGVSSSPATALLLLLAQSVRLGRTSDSDIRHLVYHITDLQPIARPNTRLLQHGARLLGGADLAAAVLYACRHF